MPLTSGEWLDRLSTQFGVDAPEAAEIEALLSLAAAAAHASERTAAPISTWLAARAGLSAEAALAAAQQLAAELASEDT